MSSSPPPDTFLDVKITLRAAETWFHEGGVLFDEAINTPKTPRGADNRPPSNNEGRGTGRTRHRLMDPSATTAVWVRQCLPVWTTITYEVGAGA